MSTPAHVREAIVEILARLRLCCEALDIDPADVDLDDVLASEGQRLRAQALLDLAHILDLRHPPERATVVVLCDDEDRARAARRTARFRAIAAERRVRRLKEGARVPRGITKRDPVSGSKGTEAQPCNGESRQHKIA